MHVKKKCLLVFGRARILVHPRKSDFDLHHGRGRMAGKIFALQAYTQSYDWGKLGSTSKAAAYACVATPGFEVDETKPYAEVGRLVLQTIPPRPCGISSTAN